MRDLSYLDDPAYWKLADEASTAEAAVVKEEVRVAKTWVRAHEARLKTLETSQAAEVARRGLARSKATGLVHRRLKLEADRLWLEYEEAGEKEERAWRAALEPNQLSALRAAAQAAQDRATERRGRSEPGA